MQGKSICSKLLIILCLVAASGTSPANTNTILSQSDTIKTKSLQTGIKKELHRVKFRKPTNKPKSINNHSVDDDDDDYTDLIDLQVGYRRPKIIDDLDLTDYVKSRLAQARKRALALYRIKQLLV
jgi:hypothetical protein